MKKASIAVALVLVFGLFGAAFSLTPAIAQYGTSPSVSSTGNATSSGSTVAAGNTTTSSTGNTTTSSNATSTQGSTFSARGSIASMIFDIGTAATNNTTETGTSSSNTTTSSMDNTTSSGNATLSGSTTGNTTLGQTIVGGNNSPGNTTGMIGTNTTTSSMDNTTSSSSSGATSTASQMNQPYILSGDWSLDVKDGTVSNLKANWTMVHLDGTGRHTHEVSNFHSANGSAIQLQQNGTTIIFGTADVMSNGSPKWTGASTVITIDSNNVASISFASEQTDNHFQGQPIYGVVNSLTENGRELVQTPGGTTTSGNTTAGNMTGSISQGAQNALNQTGSALKNATEGIKDFLNGTG